ncbi:MAG: hypothetical protein IKN81_06495 [Oscillospiraceae bacterium]|nr:hypothetical protein [Oscillospiraceae bacterium]
MDEDRLHIQTLGLFAISCAGNTVTANAGRSKAWLMVAYLICNRHRKVSRDELIRLLSEDADSGDPIRMLRNTRWNARRAIEPISSELGCELIVNADGTFGWNPDVPITVDAEELEALYKAANAAGNDKERKNLLSKAVKLYRGCFLSSFGGSFWVSRLVAYYQNLYLDAVKQLLPLLGSDEASGAVELSREALRISPYDEALCRHLMRALTELGDYGGVDAVYRQMRRHLSEELGVLPERQTLEAYQKATSRMGSGLLAPDALRVQLREEAAPKGAMICDYASFRLLYRAEARSADRRGDAIHIALLTISGKGGKPLSGRSLTWAMKQLEAQIAKTLRTGDVAASCSASQYLVMLLQTNEENAKMVCDRLIDAFERDHPNAAANVSAVVLPLEPLQTMPEGRIHSNWQYSTK